MNDAQDATIYMKTNKVNPSIILGCGEKKVTSFIITGIGKALFGERFKVPNINVAEMCEM